jgi:5,5'-dehydrodivanillate O-demethylase
VQRFLGLYWVYLGPLPAPVIPKYDAWVSDEGRRRVTFRLLDCNWLQPMENSVDPAHLQILHQNQGTNRQSGEPGGTTRGRTDDVASFDFYEVPYGIMKRRTYHNGLVDEHPLIFPNILRHQGTQIRVPIDDHHTMHVVISFQGARDRSAIQDEGDPPVSSGKAFKDPPDGHYPQARYLMDDVAAQDYMAWETQGYVADRSAERLATSDRGVVMLREMLRREIERVQQGLDPLGVIRDPDHTMIDTGLLRSVREYFGRDRSQSRGERQPVEA